MNIQIIYDETELIIHIDANDSDLPALYMKVQTSNNSQSVVPISEKPQRALICGPLQKTWADIFI